MRLLGLPLFIYMYIDGQENLVGLLYETDDTVTFLPSNAMFAL
jgi:hypothetical protein